MHVIATGVNNGKEIITNESLMIMVTFMNFAVFKIVSMMLVFNGNLSGERHPLLHFSIACLLRPKITIQKLY